MNKNDLRVIKTKNALFETLTNLMKEKTFEEIKVSDICNKALINRSTFYAHYSDKYELLADAIQNLKNSLISELKANNNISNTKEYYLNLISIFLNHIENKKDIKALREAKRIIKEINSYTDNSPWLDINEISKNIYTLKRIK